MQVPKTAARTARRTRSASTHGTWSTRGPAYAFVLAAACLWMSACTVTRVLRGSEMQGTMRKDVKLQRAKKKAKARQALRDADKILRACELLPWVADKLLIKLHPAGGLWDPGWNLLAYVEWLLVNARNKGKLRAACFVLAELD